MVSGLPLKQLFEGSTPSFPVIYAPVAEWQTRQILNLFFICP
jgi:hypothetical protein